MSCRAKQDKKMHGQSMKQGWEDQGKLKSSAVNADSGQNRQMIGQYRICKFRAIQDKKYYSDRTVQRHWCRMRTVQYRVSPD